MLKKKVIGGSVAAAMALNALLAVPFSPLAADVLKFEFEDGTQTGAASVLSDQSGYSGTGYVFLQENSDTVSVTVNAPAEGMYELNIGYAAIYGEKVQNLEINGVSQGQVSFPAGTTFEEVKYGVVKLNEGDNTVTIAGSWGWTLFDYVTIESAEAGSLECSNKLTDANATAEAQGLMNYMATVYGDYIISGQQEIYGGGHSGNYEWEFEYLNDLTGKYPAIRGFDYLNTNPMCGWNDGTTERIIDWVNNRGGIATASWHLIVPTDFASYEIGTTVQWSQTVCTHNTNTDFKVENIINDTSSKEYQYFMQSVDMLAVELKELQDAGVPLLFRPLHEAEGAGGETGSWFWWGMDGSATYKALWKLLYTTLTEEYGIHNLIWEFNSYTYPNSYNWYPGDEYVDIVGYDKYNASANNPNESAISSTFFNLVDMYGGQGKIVALTECDTIPSIDAMLDEGAYWSYFCPWYEDDGAKFLTEYNNSETLIKIYQHENVITLDEMPEYKTYEYTGEEFIPETTEPTEPTTTPEPTEPPAEGHATLTPETGYINIEFPAAVGDSAYVVVELPEGITYANGGLGGGAEVNGEYYWVNTKWEATESGAVKLDFTNPLNVTLGTEEVTDEAIIAAAIEKIQQQTTFQGQVWYASDVDGKQAATAGVEIVDAYLASAEQGTTDATEDTTEDTTAATDDTEDGSDSSDVSGGDVVYGDVSMDGKVTIVDVIYANKALLGAETLTEEQRTAADVDQSGNLEPGDSLNILKSLVKLVTLPIQ